MEGVKLVGAPLSLAEFASITDVDWFLVGVFVEPVRIWLVQNFTDQLLLFSTDAATNQFVLPPNGFLLLDFGTNKGTYNTAAFPAGNGIYVKAPTASLPSLGAVYLSYWYAD